MGYSREPTAVALCNARYGRDVTTTLKLRLIGGTQNGERHQNFVVWRHIFARFGHDLHGRKVVTPTATKSAFNKHWRSNRDGSRNWRASVAIKAKDLYEHLLAGADEIERMVAYTNACRIVDGHRVGLIMLDIDCHHGQPISDAWATADVLDDLFDAPVYWEPSTSGTGLHGFVTLLWHPTLDHNRVRSDLRELEGIIGEITADMPARCAEVRGAPMRFSTDGKTLLNMDSWAKLPRPQSRDEALRLIHTIENGLSCFEAINSARSALSSSRKKTAPQPDPSPATHPKQKEAVGRESSNGAHSSAKHPRFVRHGVSHYSGRDTFERAKEFVLWYVRHWFRSTGEMPTLHQVRRAYAEEGLDTGNSDDECLLKGYRFAIRTFDASQLGRRSIEGWLPQATKAIEEAIESNGDDANLELDLERRRVRAQAKGHAPSTIDSLRKLQPHRLSRLLACMLWVLADEENLTGGFGKSLAEKLFRRTFKQRLQEREFDAGMDWMVRNGLCELVSEAISTRNRSGRSRLYRLLGPAVDARNAETE